MTKQYYSFKEIAEARKVAKKHDPSKDISIADYKKKTGKKRVSLKHLTKNTHVNPFTEDGHTEVESVKNRLSAIKRNAEELMSIVGDQDYPEWWLAKLVKADDYLDTAKDFLQNKQDQGEV